MATMRGGEGVARALREISENISRTQRCGSVFSKAPTSPDGKPVAMIAAIQEFGAPRAGIPPRPFFRNMIAKKSPEWPAAIGELLKANNYDLARTFALAGEAIAGQLRQSIVDTNSRPWRNQRSGVRVSRSLWSIPATCCRASTTK